MTSVTISSTIDAPADEVWSRVTTFAGINHELLPFLRMTPPRHHRDASIETVPVGPPLGRVTIWYLGLLPLDHSDMRLAEVVPGRGFHEVSAMGSIPHWEHRRSLEPVDGGRRTRVTDHLDFEPRFSRRVTERMIRALFAHRHRRLTTWFRSAGT
ncbi:SRPBCC family protein [Salana multivorans]